MLHVIKALPLYSKTENAEQFINKKQDKHEKCLNKLATQKFYKKTRYLPQILWIYIFRVYSSPGAFENETTNQRAFQGHQNKYKNLPANY